MGQAKRRGDYEQRKLQAIQKVEQEELEKQAEIQKQKEEFLMLWNSWTEEEKETYRKNLKAEMEKRKRVNDLLSMFRCISGV